MDIINEVKQKLIQNSDEKYQKFSSALVPNINNVLGVRLPYLRRLAKEIYKKDWQTYLKSDSQYMEETMLKGMVIGLIKENSTNYIKDFIPQINNWSVCDSFCSSLKFTKTNKELIWKFIIPYTKSQKEYEIRFALVMMLNYFIDEEYLNSIFNIIEKCHLDDYYAMMAAAWLISICFIKYPKETMTFLKNTKIDNITYNKSIQKIIESYRIDKETKNILKTMKRN